MTPERQLPKRAYQAVGVIADGGGWGVTLDRARLKTPARTPLVLPVRDLAEAVAAEWQTQGAKVDPTTMPLTRLANVAIDRVALHMEETRAEIVAYAGSDLLCYRAEGPRALSALQASSWDPILGALSADLGVIFATGVGIAHIAQDERVSIAVRDAVASFDCLRLAALNAVTTLTGSAVLALALARRQIDADAAWQAAHVDEDWQASQWGIDPEASARRDRRWLEMAAAAQMLLA